VPIPSQRRKCKHANLSLNRGRALAVTVAITLPRLVGTRDVAQRVVDEAFGDESTSRDVTVYARAVLSAAPSFVDAFVGALQANGVEDVRVIGGSADLLRKLNVAARRRTGIRIEKGSAKPVPA